VTTRNLVNIIKPLYAIMPADNPSQGTGASTSSDSSLRDILALGKHIFLGVVLFLALGIPAVALDLLNQGVQLLKLEVSLGAPPFSRPATDPRGAGAVAVHATTVTVSAPVRYVLNGFELLLLIVDVLATGGYMLSTLARYMRSLKWG
jgi:hypothetical protein